MEINSQRHPQLIVVGLIDEDDGDVKRRVVQRHRQMVVLTLTVPVEQHALCGASL